MDDREFGELYDRMSIPERGRRLLSDPEFAEALRRRLSSVQQATPASDGAVENERVWKVSSTGRDHCFTKLFVGVPRIVRAVGDLVVVTRHWGRSRGSLCTKQNGDCPLCPDTSRRREGYFDAITTRKLRDSVEAFRIVQHIPQAGLDAIAGHDGMALRGWLLKLCVPKEKAATRVEILETESENDLPNPIDVRVPLMRFWNLDRWPFEDAAEEPGILKFRKQA